MFGIPLKSATRHREITKTYIPEHKAKASPKKESYRPKRAERKQSKTEDQAGQDRLINVSSKVYGPWPGDEPLTDEYFWGKVTRKYKGHSADKFFL
jgi:hypothetical protein